MHILTFDIEDWFHILNHASTEDLKDWNSFPSRIDEGVSRILFMLSENNLKATFFCLGWIGEKYPHVIDMISREGHEIGTHSFAHQLVYNQSRSDFVNDLKMSINILEDITGCKVTSYRAPGFSITEDCIWAFDELIHAGIEIDCSVFAANRAHGGLPNFRKATKPFNLLTSSGKLKCFPLNVVKLLNKNLVFSGGGYFRAMPFHLNQWLFKNHEYVMTYFHPRDFDPQQPRLTDLSHVRYFKAYLGLKTCEHKLRKLLRIHNFMTISEAKLQVNWDDVEELYPGCTIE
jgi:peptidoglycan-N-acetylglucosamine deacetylase